MIESRPLGKFDLPAADTTLFGVTWPLYQELSQQLRHFNGLQTQCRTMSSTWLLAALAGVGFVYSKDRALPVETDAAAAFIAFAGAVGISLLWILDVLVYHELLIASDEAARDLEMQHLWLPRVRKILSQLHSGLSVRANISLFYIGSTLLLMFVAAFAAGRLLWARNMTGLSWLVFVALFGSGALWGRVMYSTARDRLAKKNERRPPIPPTMD